MPPLALAEEHEATPKALATEAETTYVAEVSGTQYETLGAAYDAVSDGGIIDILTEVNLDEEPSTATAAVEGGIVNHVLSINKSITINGNHKGITTTAICPICISQSGIAVLLKDWTIETTSTAAYTRAILFRNDLSDITLTLDGCSLSCGYYALNLPTGNSNHIISILNGTIAAGWAAINSYSNDSTFYIDNSV